MNKIELHLSKKKSSVFSQFALSEMEPVPKVPVALSFFLFWVEEENVNGEK